MSFVLSCLLFSFNTFLTTIGDSFLEADTAAGTAAATLELMGTVGLSWQVPGQPLPA